MSLNRTFRRGENVKVEGKEEQLEGIDGGLSSTVGRIPNHPFFEEKNGRTKEGRLDFPPFGFCVFFLEYAIISDYIMTIIPIQGQNLVRKEKAKFPLRPRMMAREPFLGW